MHEGDHLLLYTDGVWETLADEDGRAEERFSERDRASSRRRSPAARHDSRRRPSRVGRSAAGRRSHAPDGEHRRANLVYPRGFAPRTPRHALSRAAAPARSARVARSPCSLASGNGVRFMRRPPVSSEGLRPSDSPTRALARRCVGALRSRGSLAMLARTTRKAREVYEMASRSHPRGFAPRTPRHALSRAASSARSVRVARSPLARIWERRQVRETASSLSRPCLTHSVMGI